MDSSLTLGQSCEYESYESITNWWYDQYNPRYNRIGSTMYGICCIDTVNWNTVPSQAFITFYWSNYCRCDTPQMTKFIDTYQRDIGCQMKWFSKYTPDVYSICPIKHDIPRATSAKEGWSDIEITKDNNREISKWNNQYEGGYITMMSNRHIGVSNHQRFEYLFNNFLKFLTSNAEKCSIWRRQRNIGNHPIYREPPW